MNIMTIDEKIERATHSVKAHLEKGFLFIELRGKLRRLLPFEVRYLKGQKHDHSALSKDGHEWELADHGQCRHCVKCFTSQSNCSGDWIFLVGPFSREDVEHLVRQDERRFKESLVEK